MSGIHPAYPLEGFDLGDGIARRPRDLRAGLELLSMFLTQNKQYYLNHFVEEALVCVGDS